MLIGESQLHQTVGNKDQNDPYILGEREEKVTEVVTRYHCALGVKVTHLLQKLNKV